MSSLAPPVIHATSLREPLKYFQAADPGAEYWDAIWTERTVQETYRRELKGHLPWQLRQTILPHLAPRADILEAGCGLAHFTVAMAARGHQAQGLDWGPKVIAALQQRFPSIPFRHGDARSMPFPSASFDLVYSPGVCEHFEEGPEPILEESIRVLRPGGMLVVSTPLFNQLRMSLHRFGRFRSEPDPHLSFYQYAFTIDDMSARLERLGLEVLAVRPYGALKTLADHVGLPRRLPTALRSLLGRTLDLAPITRQWGHSCIWIGRRS